MKNPFQNISPDRYRPTREPPEDPHSAKYAMPLKAVPHYFIVYIDLITELELKQNEALLLCYIGGFAKEKQWCYASQATMGNAIRQCVSAVDDALKTLESKGLIERSEERHRNRTIKWRPAKHIRDKISLLRVLLSQENQKRAINCGKTVGFG